MNSKSAFSGTVAVMEAADTAQRRTREVVKSLGYRLAVEFSEDGIERRFLAMDPPRLLLVSLPEAADLVKRLRASPIPPIIVASLSGPPESARERFSEMDADLYAVRPHSVDSLGPILYAAAALVDGQMRLAALRSSEERLRDRLHQAGHSGENTGFQHFDFFQKFLLLEIKRAKRFGYMIAVCIVAFDGEQSMDSDVRDSLSSKVALAITSNIRDIDLPVDFAKDRMLLFLPYTDLSGAEEVAGRVLAQVRSAGRIPGDAEGRRISVSIGVAATTEGHEISFAKLVRDANAALKAAQSKGGNRVICR